MNEVITKGIVLSVMPMGEYDRRLEILTADYGRISAFARGARKSGSSLISVTRAFAFGEFHLYQGKRSYSLSSAVISNYFEELSSDFELTCYGFYFLELTQYFSRENVEALEMLKLLYYSLKALTFPAVSNHLVRRIFELKMLDLNGLCPTAERLFSQDEMHSIYSWTEGLGEGCRKAYRQVLYAPAEKQYTFTLSQEVLEEFDTLVSRLLGMNVDRRFKSLELLQ